MDSDAQKNGKQKMSLAERKREERAKWWLSAIGRAFDDSDNSLFEHPAILAAVREIESVTETDEKVLVFGRFTRPMRALVNLLNAREMLRCVQAERPWPQAEVHGDPKGNVESSDWPAVRAAHRHLNCKIPLSDLDAALRKSYDRESRNRQKFRSSLVRKIGEGMTTIPNPGSETKLIFEAFSRSVEQNNTADHSSLGLVSRAIADLIGTVDDDTTAADCASAFCQLIVATRDRDDIDGDLELDDEEAAEHWGGIEKRLIEEMARTRGGFARLMFGGTGPESRRLIQLAFNRSESYPRVLVAQSLVGREGLNLHKACRIVVLLHPEWNPGVVEQQIGRVDRVGSHWCKELNEAIEANTAADQLPRIEVRPIIFRGTYDEWNWDVLKTRWDNLRSQLHGVVITPSTIDVDDQTRKLIDELEQMAPNFSPSRRG